jgi:hypothetical protein
MKTTGYRLALYPLVTSVVSQDTQVSTLGSQNILTGFMRISLNSERCIGEDFINSQFQHSEHICRL